MTGLPALCCVARAAGGLEGGGAERAEQLDQMRAAFDAAERSSVFLRQPGPIVTPLSALKLGVMSPHGEYGPSSVIASASWIFMSRSIVSAQPHIVHRLARLALAPAVMARGGAVGLGVDEMRLDVPQAVFTLVAVAFDGAVVHELARGGVGDSGMNWILQCVQLPDEAAGLGARAGCRSMP